MMNKLINNHFTNENEVIQKATRDGTEVEKGVVLTKDYIDYSSGVSRVGSKIGTSLDKLMDGGIKDFLELLGSLF